MCYMFVMFIHDVYMFSGLHLPKSKQFIRSFLKKLHQYIVPTFIPFLVRILASKERLGKTTKSWCFIGLHSRMPRMLVASWCHMWRGRKPPK